MEDVVYKHPDAILSYDVDFTDQLADADASLTGDGATATDSNGDDKSATVIGTETKSGLVLTVPFKAGTDGEDYIIIIQATGDSSGLIAVKTVEMRVRVEELGNK